MNVRTKPTSAQANHGYLNHLFEVRLSMCNQIDTDRHVQMVIARQVIRVDHFLDHLLGFVANFANRQKKTDFVK